MITVKTPTTKEQFKTYYALRYKVLSEPWGHPKGTEKDDFEPLSEHFMAVNEAGEVLGVIKLFEKAPGIGNFSHLAVAPAHQRQGIGHLLLEAVEKRARERGFKTLGAMVRVTATAYFEKRGYHFGGAPAPHLSTSHSIWLEKDL